MKKIILIIIVLFIGFILFSGLGFASTTELLTSPWHYDAYHKNQVFFQTLTPTVLNGKIYSQITLDLHGKCLDTTYSGNAIAVFDQPTLDVQYQVSLFPYLQNCLNGSQSLTIPLSAYKLFSTSLNPILNTVRFRIQFYYASQMNFDVTSMRVYDTLASSVPIVSPSPTLTPTPSLSPSPKVTPSPTSTPLPSPNWEIESNSAMKVTKDVICSPKSSTWIGQFVDKSVELGSKYVEISQPYDNPACGNSVAYTQLWVNIIRSRGLKVWHRHMPLAYEGIYNVPKSNSIDYVAQISAYILANPTFFADGDIFTPIPEPANAGIGTSGCSQNICMFSTWAAYNQFLRNLVNASKSAFLTIGRSNMKVGYFGHNGWEAWGDLGTIGQSKLEPATVAAMDNVIAVDHYPANANLMASDLDELHSTWPNATIILSEWGTINETTTQAKINAINTVMTAAKRSYIKGFNYWTLGPDGLNEPLINADFSNKPQFATVSAYFH